jgi:Zn-dependent protease with chaperone function
VITLLILQLAGAASSDVEACRKAMTTAGLRQTAIEACDRAAGKDPSARNLTLLAAAILLPDGPHPTEDDVVLAKQVAARAVAAEPDSPLPQRLLCELALRTIDHEGLRRCSEVLLRVDFMSPRTQLYAARVAIVEARWDDAERAVGRARDFGLDRATVDKLTSAIERNRGVRADPDWFRALLWTLAVWFGGILVLYALGSVLSRLTLRVARRVPGQRTAEVQGAGALLRGVYTVVLWLCCAYYYLSIPFMLLAVVGAGGGAIYLICQMTIINLYVLFAIAAGMLATLGAVFTSLFVARRDVEPGLRLEPARYALLRPLLEEVAAKIGTRPVDEVYLVPGTEIGVSEVGGMLRQMGRSSHQRRLILGAGVLEGLTVRDLKPLLAHEYGHFSNRDTAGGGFALAVRRSMLVMALRLKQGRAALWFNPAWWFVNGFVILFARISQGASRLQEVLADRWAAFAFGSDKFERAMRHLIGRTMQFNARAAAIVDEVIREKRALPNLYTYPLAKPVGPPDLSRAVEAQLTVPAGTYDSHPSVGDRIAWARALAAPSPESSPEDDREVWTMIQGREELERQMTTIMRVKMFVTRGVRIPESDQPAPAASSAG